MRIYLDEQKKELITVICNKCKKELNVQNGIVKEGCFCGDSQFGYFSRKDGKKLSFDLCEDCYDKIVKSFAIPAEEEDLKELM